MRRREAECGGPGMRVGRLGPACWANTAGGRGLLYHEETCPLLSPFLQHLHAPGHWQPDPSPRWLLSLGTSPTRQAPQLLVLRWWCECRGPSAQAARRDVMWNSCSVQRSLPRGVAGRGGIVSAQAGSPARRQTTGREKKSSAVRGHQPSRR